jgi:hypothetical protein
MPADFPDDASGCCAARRIAGLPEEGSRRKLSCSVIRRPEFRQLGAHPGNQEEKT